MTFDQALRACLDRYAVFAGRAGRPEFWWFVLFVAIVSSVASFIDSLMDDRPGITFYVGIGAHGWLSLVVMALVVVPLLAAGARRLHDVGQSGWWQLLLLIPCLGWIPLVVLWCRRGHAEPNQHGAPIAGA